MPDDLQKKTSKYRKTPAAFDKFLEDCERPACDDVKAMFIKAKTRLTESQKKDEQEETSAPAVECPPSSGALGTATWTLLHSMVSKVFTRHSRTLWKIHVQHTSHHSRAPLSHRRLGILMTPRNVIENTCSTFLMHLLDSIRVHGVPRTFEPISRKSLSGTSM